jgi:signal transduction histidine kinase
MRERVRHLGGELTIESNSSGTKVSASFSSQIRSSSNQSVSQQAEVA